MDMELSDLARPGTQSQFCHSQAEPCGHVGWWLTHEMGAAMTSERKGGRQGATADAGTVGPSLRDHCRCQILVWGP